MSRAIVVAVTLALVAAFGAAGYRASFECVGSACAIVAVPTEGAGR